MVTGIAVVEFFDLGLIPSHFVSNLIKSLINGYPLLAVVIRIVTK